MLNVSICLSALVWLCYEWILFWCFVSSWCIVAEVTDGILASFPAYLLTKCKGSPQLIVLKICLFWASNRRASLSALLSAPAGTRSKSFLVLFREHSDTCIHFNLQKDVYPCSWAPCLIFSLVIPIHSKLIHFIRDPSLMFSLQGFTLSSWPNEVGSKLISLLSLPSVAPHESESQTRNRLFEMFLVLTEWSFYDLRSFGRVGKNLASFRDLHIKLIDHPHSVRSDHQVCSCYIYWCSRNRAYIADASVYVLYRSFKSSECSLVRFPGEVVGLVIHCNYSATDHRFHVCSGVCTLVFLVFSFLRFVCLFYFNYYFVQYLLWLVLVKISSIVDLISYVKIFAV